MRKPAVHRRPLLAAPWALLATPSFAQVSDAPAKPLRLIVAFGAGGIADLVSRILAEGLARELNQPVVVENRTGAGGNVAAEFVARSPPDGRVLFFATAGVMAVNPLIYTKLAIDPARDLDPIALVAATPHTVVSHPRVAADWPGLLAAARVRQEALSWGTAGAGSSPHQTLLLLQSLTGTRWLPVHFRSGAASIQAVLAGDVSATAEATPVVIEHIRAGTLRAYCVASPARLDLMPEVPTGEELGLPDLENGSVAGIAAPRGLPEPVRVRLSAAVAATLASPDVKARLLRQGTVPLAGDGAAFAAVLTQESIRWKPLLAGVRVD